MDLEKRETIDSREKLFLTQILTLLSILIKSRVFLEIKKRNNLFILDKDGIHLRINL